MKIVKPLLLTAALGVICATGFATSSSGHAREPVQLDGRLIDLSNAQPLHSKGTRPTIGLVLGGGGLRGLAHVGVLKALEEAGIKPDLVVGTSAGAVVGAVYASGKSPDEIQKLAAETSIPSLVDFTLSTGGVMRGDNIAKWIDNVTGNRTIEHFPLRYAAVATDLRLGVPVLLEHGSAGDVVRASASVPGVQVPVPYRNGYLVDGGVSSLVPVRASRALGADIVIAVDIYCRGVPATALNAAAVVQQSMHAQSCLLSAPELESADIRIQPEVAIPDISDKKQQQETIRIGYESAKKALARADLKLLR